MRIDRISLSQLSANAIVSREDLFVPMRSYFDGGNQSQPKQYKTMTLAAVSGRQDDWDKCEGLWGAMLKVTGTRYIHVTDMLSLQNDFTKAKGWNKDRVNAVLTQCVGIIGDCMAKPEDLKADGIMPVSITVVLADFKRALLEIPNLRTPELHLALGCFQLCGHWCDTLHVRRIQLFFDQNEPFYGHICDRMTNKKSRKEERSWKSVIARTKADSREVIGLQVADVIAWAAGSFYERGKATHSWQRKLLKIHAGETRILWDYEKLKSPDREAMDALDAWGIPPRKSFS